MSSRRRHSAPPVCSPSYFFSTVFQVPQESHQALKKALQRKGLENPKNKAIVACLNCVHSTPFQSADWFYPYPKNFRRHYRECSEKNGNRTVEEIARARAKTDEFVTDIVSQEEDCAKRVKTGVSDDMLGMGMDR